MKEYRVKAILELEDRLSNAFSTVAGRIQGVGKTLSNVGSTLTKYVTVPLIGIGVAGFKVAADFEQAMANVRSVTMASDKDMKLLSETAVKMAKKYKGSAKDAADALYYIASAGYNARQSMDALEGVMALASATNQDLAYTSEAVMAAISMFGMKASETTRVADVYARTIQLSQATMSKLADSMRYAGAVTHSLGWDIEETAATLAQLYNAGYKGEQAGTILRGALSRLLDPSREVREALKKLGITMDELSQAMDSPVELIDLFRKHSITAKDAVKIFGLEAGPGMISLISGGAEKIAEYEKELRNAGGTAEKAASVQLATLHGKLEAVKDAFEAIAINLAKNEGALDTLAGLLNNVATALSNLTPQQQSLIVYLGLTLIALGPLLKVLGFFLTHLSTISTVLGTFTAILSSLPGLLAGGALAVYLLAGKILGLNTNLSGAIQGFIALKNLGVANVIFSPITTAANTLKSTIDILRSSINQTNISLRDAKTASDQYRLAKLAAKEADLQVKLAQDAYNQAVKTFGANSAQAKQAEIQLQLARQNQKTATQRVKDTQEAYNEKLREAYKKEEELRIETKYLSDMMTAVSKNKSAHSWLDSLISRLKSAWEWAKNLISKLLNIPTRIGGGGGGGGGGHAVSRQLGGYIRESGIFYGHRGELVLPRQVVDFMKRTGLGGGVNIHLNVNFSGVSVRNERDLEALAHEVSRLLSRQLELSLRGVF